MTITYPGDPQESLDGVTSLRHTRTMTATDTPRSTWARIAARMEAGHADGIEQNAAELYELDSDEFFAECIGQAD